MLATAPVCAANPCTVRASAQARPALKALALKRVATSLGAAAVVLSAAAAPVLAAPDLKLGTETFENNCAACHTGGGNTVAQGKTLQKAALEQFLDGGFNVEAIITQVTNGKNAMPAWEDRLTEEQIEAVANYVYDQASGNKW